MSTAEAASARVGVFHAPGGAATLQEIYRAAAADSAVVMIFREAVAAAHPDVVAAAHRLFEVALVPDKAPIDTLWPLALSGVTTFHDEELDIVDAVAAALELPSAPALENPWDKLVQREMLRAHGVCGVRALPVESPLDFRVAARTLGLPCVLKPRRAVSGQGIAFIDSPDDVGYQLQARRHWPGHLLETAVAYSTSPSTRQRRPGCAS